MRMRTEAKREAIIEAAAELFKESGYEGASMNELANRLGGSKATLYGYFPSKENLFSAVVRKFATSHLSKATVELQKCPESWEALQSVLRRFAGRVLSYHTGESNVLAVCRMVIAESGRSDVGVLFLEAGPRECISALAVVMGKAMERHELRDGDPRVFAVQYFALITAEINYRLYQRNLKPLGPQAIRRLAGHAVDMFLEGAKPR